MRDPRRALASCGARRGEHEDAEMRHKAPHSAWGEGMIIDALFLLFCPGLLVWGLWWYGRKPEPLFGKKG